MRPDPFSLSRKHLPGAVQHIWVMLAGNSVCPERKRQAWGQLVQVVFDSIPRCSLESCGVAEEAAGGFFFFVFRVIFTFIQPQVKVLPWPQGSKGWFISCILKEKLGFSSQGVGNASQL